MRFYHEIQNLVYPHLRLILQDPFLRFANDIVYFFSCEYETGWKPYNVYEEHHKVTWKAAPRFYTPHKLSPLSNDIRRAMKISTAATEPVYPALYALAVCDCGEDKLHHFITEVFYIIDKHFEGHSDALSHISNLFFTVLHIARMGVFFHQMGTPDTPHVAATLISYLLFREQKATGYNNNVFQLFHLFSEKIVEQHKKSRNKL